MERRSTLNTTVKLETREDGKPPKINGIGAVYYDGTPDTEYELWDGARERIMPGAFDGVLDNDVRGLFNHDPSQVLGRTTSGTMRLKADKEGLHYEIDGADTSVSRDVQEHLRRGDVSGSSFAFSVSDERWVKEDNVEVREVTRIGALYDTGPVTYPAYESTTAGVRAAPNAGGDEARASYDAWKRQEAYRKTKATIDQTKKW